MTGYKKIAIAGGTGNIGKYITEAFVASGEFEVTVLSRRGESEIKKQFKSQGISIVEIDYQNTEGLVKALQGSEVVISALPALSFSESQAPLLEAAKQARIARFIPSEFCFNLIGESHNYCSCKVNGRQAVLDSGLEYTIYLGGFFMEQLISTERGFDIKERKIEIVSNEFTPFRVTSMKDIAQFMVETINLPQAINNTLVVSGEITTVHKLAQYFTNCETTILSAEQAQKILTDTNSSQDTLFYLILKDIESGAILHVQDHTSLAPKMKSLTIREYIKNNFKA